jgi:hypothetical protein
MVTKISSLECPSPIKLLTSSTQKALLSDGYGALKVFAEIRKSIINMRQVLT